MTNSFSLRGEIKHWKLTAKDYNLILKAEKNDVSSDLNNNSFSSYNSGSKKELDKMDRG